MRTFRSRTTAPLIDEHAPTHTGHESAVVVRNLRMSYGDFEAVDGVSFDIRRGEIFALLGPNGAGKTTTIEILEGYRRRSDGDVLVLDVDPERPTRGWRERIGLVLQECELDPNLTVRETVSLFASFYPAPRPVDGTIELVGLTDVADDLIGRLSGGQRRRADVALGIVGDPELIFLDEPTTGFDPSARRAAWSMIDGLRTLGKTTLLTTHYMDEAQRLADRIGILRAGQLVAMGTVAEIGAGLRSEAIIRFRLPRNVGATEVAAATGFQLETLGDVSTVRAPDPQWALYQLTQWAELNGVRLEDIEVGHRNLEDMFLELTREEVPK
jgi:ABC-2 type transport system ATP-binding protein